MNADNSVSLQNALILHTRPYQNSSLLVDFFTERDGIIRCVAKGARAKRKKIQLTQFCLYRINYSGRSDLKTLKTVEPSDRYALEKQALLCGFYVNELVLRLLHPQDPFPDVFRLVCETLSLLENAAEPDSFSITNNQTDSNKVYDLEIVLRRFELSLFYEIGYLMDLRYDCKTGHLIEEQNTYTLLKNEGFTLVLNERENQIIFSGKILDILSRRAFDELFLNTELKKEAKIISRLMLAPHLDNRPLQSKSLFEKFKSIHIH